MAPAARNKVTKTPTKSPKASTPKSSPNKHTPTQAMSALTEDINARILWFVLSEFLNAGQTVSITLMNPLPFRGRSNGLL